MNNEFWKGWKQTNGVGWRENFVGLLMGKYAQPEISLFHDNSWTDNELYVQVFKVFASFELSWSTFNSITNKTEYLLGNIKLHRLEILRQKCDALAGPELITMSSADNWCNRRDLQEYFKYLFWFFSIVDFDFWTKGDDFTQQKFYDRVAKIARDIPNIHSNHRTVNIFYFFSSDVTNFNTWSMEAQEFFYALFAYHLPNDFYCLISENWQAQLKNLFEAKVAN